MSVNCLHPVSVVTKNMYVFQKFFDRDKHPQTRWIKSTHIGKFGKKGWQEAQKAEQRRPYHERANSCRGWQLLRGSLRPQCGVLNTYEDITTTPPYPKTDIGKITDRSEKSCRGYTDIVFIKNLLSTADSTPCGPGDSKSGPADSKSAKGNILLSLLIWRSCAEPTFQLQIPKARKEPSFSFCSSG